MRYNELRYHSPRADPARGNRKALLEQAQADVIEKYRIYEGFANLGSGPTAAHVTA